MTGAEEYLMDLVRNQLQEELHCADEQQAYHARINCFTDPKLTLKILKIRKKLENLLGADACEDL